MCAQCADFIVDVEAIGGALLDSCAPMGLGENALDKVLTRIDGETISIPAIEKRCERSLGAAERSVPSPLRSYLDRPLDQLKWRQRGPVGEIRLLPDMNGYETRLLKIRAGAKLPSHTHDGLEATLVLRGSFADCTGEYRRGDLAMADHDLDHSPIAGGEEMCICLAVTTAPLRLTGTIGRLLNPFVRL